MMIFQHTWGKVLSGEKTQTRRLKKQNTAGSFSDGKWWAVYNTVTGMPKWEIGRDYAVQPGRTQKAIARIQVMDIRCEDVREISAADACAEGFENWFTFMDTWLMMHDRPMLNKWEHWIYRLNNRPAERYLAWVLTFELVK